MLLIGVDIGTSSTKGVLVDESGRIIASHLVFHSVNRPQPTWAEQDADQVWWGGFVAVVRSLMSQAPKRSKIAGIGVSGTCPTLLPVDYNGKPLRPGILYSIDRRAIEEINEINSKVGPKEILESSGNVLSTQCIGPKMLWLMRHEPQLYKRTKWFLGTNGYVVLRLTGVACWDHFSAGDGGYGYDFSNCKWDVDALNRMGIDFSLLPQLRWSTELVGTVISDAARETGLPEGTPVIAGVGDAAAEMVSTGVIEDGSLVLLYGSSLVTMSSVRKPYVSSGFILTPGLEPDNYFVSSVLGTGCALIEWLRNVLNWNDRVPDYDLLENEAMLVKPGSNDLIIIPYLTGQRSPEVNPNMFGAILGINQSHTFGHLYRASLEGMAFALRYSLSKLEKAGLLKDYEIVAGGGGSKSELWTQIVTNVCRREQKLISGSVQAPIGSAFLAGKAVGIFSSENLKKWVTYQKTIRVQKNMADIYDHSYGLFMKYLGLLAQNI
ncbi:FGGY-family carbohydrate kinase [Atribacter laminatus]|uniref:Xylulose kinase n=1 Tax=Atribacter laminatus TaxID=2847778 RepID=A0A7T1F2D0_ATRLM|nr:FGGY family carbohydrate kinase [Atribacter laminatus]QPM67650.1 Xylulose kinase [Atribacter laminatus]